MTQSTRRRTTNSSSRKLIITTTTWLVSTTVVTAHNHRPWNLPPTTTSVLTTTPSANNFVKECESLAAFLAKVRGGSSSWYDNNDDEDDYYYNDDNNNKNWQNYQDDYEYEEDYGLPPAPKQQKNNNAPAGSAFLNSLPSVVKNGDRRIGLSLLGSGTVVTMLGISLFFNKTLMRLGNLLFIAGVPITLGPTRTLGYFLKKEKARATGCLALGIFLVFIGMPVFGICLEAFGILNLFGNLFPVVWAIAKNMPGIGPILSGNSNNNNNNNRRSRRDDYDDYYGDQKQDPYYDDYGYGDGDKYD